MIIAFLLISIFLILRQDHYHSYILTIIANINQIYAMFSVLVFEELKRRKKRTSTPHTQTHTNTHDN